MASIPRASALCADHAALLPIRTSPSPTQTISPANPVSRWQKPPAPRASCSNSNDGESSSHGDKNKQELLARIAMLQTQKVRLTDYLDERSDYLSKVGEDANAEFDKLGEDALKELDEAGARIMENLDSRMQALEESSEINMQEIEKNEKVLEDFEDQVDRDRNEGLFFKSLSSKKASQISKKEAKVEAQKVKETIKDSAGSKTRRNIYLVLISLLAITIGNAVVATPEVEWRKVAALALILIGLVTQLVYEQSLSPTSEKQGEEKD